MEILSDERKLKMNGILIVLVADAQIQPKEELLLGKKFFIQGAAAKLNPPPLYSSASQTR